MTNESPTTIQLDRFTRMILTALTLLLAIIAVELWAFAPDTTHRASAQIPDTGMQRKLIVDETKRTNELLEQILDHLETKPIRVHLIADEKSDTEGQRRSGARK